MNKKTMLAYAIVGFLTNGKLVLAEESKGTQPHITGEKAKNPNVDTATVGLDSESKNQKSLAAGSPAKSNGRGSASRGANSKFKGEHSFASGNHIRHDHKGSPATGLNKKPPGRRLLSVGNPANSESAGSAGMNLNGQPKGDHSLAAGSSVKNDKPLSNSMGLNSKPINSLAVGSSAKSDGLHSVSIGLKSKSNGEDSLAIGTTAKSDGKGSVAIGLDSKSNGENSLAVGMKAMTHENNGVAIGSFSEANRKYDKEKLKSIMDKQDDKLGVKIIREVSLGDIKNEKILSQITNVAAATESTDAVNLYQLNMIKSDIDKKISEADKVYTSKNAIEQFESSAKNEYELTLKHRDNANKALTETKKHRDNVYDAFNKVKMHETNADLITKRLKREALLMEGKINQTPDGTMYIGKTLQGNLLSVSGTQGDRVITGVLDGTKSNDAVNISQLNQVESKANAAHEFAQKNTVQINNLENQVSKTNKKIDRGLAASAALTGLFQPYGVGKVNVTAGVGGYGSSQALAMGTGYRVNENAAVKAGLAYSGSNSMIYNASFNLEW